MTHPTSQQTKVNNMEQEFQTTITKPNYNDWMRSLREKAMQTKTEQEEGARWQGPP
jgi:hypothetical protein